MLASISGLSEVVRLLLGAGADVHITDRLGLTAIEWSKRRGFLDVADLLEDFEKRDAAPPPVAMTEQTVLESASETPIETETPVETMVDVASGGEADVRTDKEEDDKAEKEKIRLDHVAKIQALFDQLKVAEKDSAPHQVRTPRESSASSDDTRDSVPEDQRLREERLKAEDERISRVHGAGDFPVPDPASLSPAPEENSVKTETPKGSVEAERAANELAREKSRLDAERVAEATRLRVEEAVRKRSLRHEGIRIQPEPGKGRDMPPAKLAKQERSKPETERIGAESAQRVKDQVHQTLPPRGMRIITQDIWPVQPVTSVASPTALEPVAVAPERCPKCNAELQGEHCPHCGNKDISVISIPSFSSPHSHVLARPTIWMLMSVTLAGGVFLGYQLNEYISKNERSSTPLVAAPVSQPVSAKPEVTPEPPQDTPLVGGALSGAEATIPKPEYPAGAKSQGVSGKITVRVRVNNRGRVILARSSTGDWRLRAAAVQAAKKATFAPDKLNADQRFVSGTITYTFKP